MALTEWLVTDQRGAFAMGTLEGARTRKYHGFFMGIPGRTEAAFLADLEIECNGKLLWPHRYAAPEGGVLFPDPIRAGIPMRVELKNRQPTWTWELSPRERLSFTVRPRSPLGGIELAWAWEGPAGRKTSPARLRIRSFWAMRALHGVGGQAWVFRDLGTTDAGRRGRIELEEQGTDGSIPSVEVLLENLRWESAPDWYRQFHYSEEEARGYLASEDLYSAGWMTTELRNGQGASLSIAFDAKDLQQARPRSRTRAYPPAVDFVLLKPPGIVAGYPWFGEWGRDTFVSLPGIAASWLRAGTHPPEEIRDWVVALFESWGTWIDRAGMIPNLIEKGGSHPWDSADGTLWWCHAAAALWALSLAGGERSRERGGGFPFAELPTRLGPLLDTAIQSIREGRHLFLHEAEDGLLEVTEPHTTWMDARVDGAAITPRRGKLPEINALWFQARCLQLLWRDARDIANMEEVEAIGRKTLLCEEPDRPNRIFLHSIPLAPSFVLGDRRALEADLQETKRKLWTPAGLRTLSPGAAGFQSICEGNQERRDRAYHQGLVWGWLGGHYKMAEARLGGAEQPMTQTRVIEGHVPEIFDAVEPFAPRGAPAQAWSLACDEEAEARKKARMDAKLSRILAQRWLGRRGRREEMTG